MPAAARTRRRLKRSVLQCAVLVSIALLGTHCSHASNGDAAARAQRVARGAEAIQTYGCGSCHVIPGIRRADGLVGPSLENLRARAFIAGRLPNSLDSLVRWIMMPQYYDPGVAMPDLHVSEPDARAIAAYLYDQ